MRPVRPWWAVCFLLLVTAPACSRAREYELRGQVLAVDPARQELTIKHEDVRGFMPAMTMPFKVRDAAAFAARSPGDLIRATLVVENNEGYLKDLTSTGRAPVVDPVPPPRVDVLRAGESVPDTVFLDQSGQAHTLADWRGQAIAVTFIYTRCPVPDFCPLMDRRFRDVQALVTKEPSLAGRVHLVSITFDPSYDTPDVLSAHARKVGADPAIWSFFTGDRSDVLGFAARFGATIVPDQASAPEIVHNLRTAVIDPRGRLAQILTGNDWTAEQLVAGLRSAGGGR